ncbi:MAG: hypothetical protein V2J55_00700 [Candidatus Competibacteraceae bacterium]|nr:hypothetical protein [Candidatus Competibacteraceae bacterium]
MLIDLHTFEDGRIVVTRHGELPPVPWRLNADFPVQEPAFSTETVDDTEIYESVGGLWVDSPERGSMPAERWYGMQQRGER